MNITKITPELYLISLDQKLRGFTTFISAWLYKDDRTFLVDPGPSSTIPVLLKALENLNVQHLDAILLTHIHIDHAGGAGDLVQKFPDTPVICHNSGIRHLSDPSRLWEGSLKTLGKIAETYGAIQAVPSDLLHDAAQFQDYGIKPFLTPGHAPHHVSYQFEDYLFAGETGGVFIDLVPKPELGNEKKPAFYLRPATPPKFFLETSIQSIDTLMNISHKIMCYGHFGATTKGSELLDIHKKQLFLWADIIREQMRKQDSDASQPDESFLNTCLEVLLKKDPQLGGWKYLDAAIQDRERYFLRNSIRGFATGNL